MTATVMAGLIFGATFARRGIESAMVAHSGAHLVGAAVTSLLSIGS